MILSRVWYVILAILVGAAFYCVSLAVGQYNRRNAQAMAETVKSDGQVVSWALQVDARRRLDNLLIGAVDPNVGKALRAANGKDPIPTGAKDDGKKGLSTFNDKLPPEYKSDALFVVDREGRLIAELGYDQSNASPQFELGGYPAVFDALHGQLRDDTWVWGGRIARVVARPVEDEVGQPPLGAIIALRWADQGFAKDLAKRTRTNVAFFAFDQRISSAAATEEFDEHELELIGQDLPHVDEDKAFKETGRTDVRPLGDKDQTAAVYVRLPGDAWELGAGFAVVRDKIVISNGAGFITGADDKDKASVKLWVVAAIIILGSAFGIGFSVLEHSMPRGEMVKQATRLKKGEIDTLQLARFRGGFRGIAQDINSGIERVVEKGGGQARKPADLESILGPVPAQPAMSAFSFPLSDPSAAPGQNPGGPRPPPGSVPGIGAPPPQGSRPGQRMDPPAFSPPAPQGAGAPERTVAMPGVPPPGIHAPRPMPGPMPGSVGSFAASQTAPAAFPPPAAALAKSGPMAPPPPTEPANEEEEATMIGKPPPDLLAAASGAASGNMAAASSNGGEPAEWMGVYEDFIRTKRECNEPVDGLTFEKFQQTLKKNRDALIQRHGCKRVKFSVYVKDGRASLKATPVRE